MILLALFFDKTMEVITNGTPTDAPVGTVVATYFAIKTGCDLDTALALAAV